MFKNNFFLAILVVVLAGCTSGNSGESPQPTETVYLPAPESPMSTNLESDLNSDLTEIKETNCSLAQELMFQSIDLERQARDLESQSYSLDSNPDISFKLKDQARKLRQQSIDLSIKSSSLQRNC